MTHEERMRAVGSVLTQYKRTMVVEVVKELSEANCGPLKQLDPEAVAHLALDVLPAVERVMSEVETAIKKALTE